MRLMTTAIALIFLSNTALRAENFDVAGWAQASVYTAADVDPKFGYCKITWHDDAKFIGRPDLEQSNTALCRLTVEEYTC